MLEADDVDIDYFTPIASTSLAKIFGSDTKIEENVSLKYEQKSPQSQTPKEEDSKATKVICACAVVGYEWSNNAYTFRGKLGAAIIKTLKSGQHNLILYDTNKVTISNTMISSQLEVIIKGDTNLSFYDNQKRYWSINGTQVELPLFIAKLKSLNVLIKDSSNQMEPIVKSLATNDNVSNQKDDKNFQEYQHHKDEKESDTDSAIYKKTKDSILKRMATMGHSVLPIQSLKSMKSSESSESDESAQKVVRHKPQKSNLRKILTDKADLSSDICSEIDLTQKMSIANRSADVPLSQQQLVPIKSTNIIHPIINNSNELSIFMSEQRMSNTEMRININRLSDKMDRILEKVQSDSENNSSRHFQNNVMQKLLDEYENKINYYENFLQSKGFDVNIIAKPIEKKETPINSNVFDLNVHQNKIHELQSQLEEQNKENLQLKNDLQSLNEKYLSCFNEFKHTCNDHTKEINKLKQELTFKQKEMISKSCESIVLPNNDFKSKLKSIMNETFHSLSANFDNNENYTGTVIKSVIASVIKKETIKALKEV